MVSETHTHARILGLIYDFHWESDSTLLWPFLRHRRRPSSVRQLKPSDHRLTWTSVVPMGSLMLVTKSFVLRHLTHVRHRIGPCSNSFLSCRNARTVKQWDDYLQSLTCDILGEEHLNEHPRWARGFSLYPNRPRLVAQLCRVERQPWTFCRWASVSMQILVGTCSVDPFYATRHGQNRERHLSSMFRERIV